jgi:putative membrane protein
MYQLKNYLILFIKGIAMGTANIIPGVSGGTIALITGIFERLINALKNFNTQAFRLLGGGKWKEFAQHIDLYFLLAIFAGVGIALISLARIFDFLFSEYPVFIWSYFFGLVMASVYFVGKTVSRWTIPVYISFVAGVVIAAGLTFLNPATENSGFLYLILCGVVAVCSMILPGLSGSFVLILMGNYQLVAIDAINDRDMGILLPVLIGAVFGLLAFSHFLSWLLKKYKPETIAVLTGFILGSLSILWPWKEAVHMKNASGELLIKDGAPVVERYMVSLPEAFNTEVMLAMVIMIAGIATIWIIESLAKPSQKKTKPNS